MSRVEIYSKKMEHLVGAPPPCNISYIFTYELVPKKIKDLQRKEKKSDLRKSKTNY